MQYMLIVAVLVMAGCSSANRAAYVSAECTKAGYTTGTPEYDGCVEVKDREARRGSGVVFSPQKYGPY